MNATGDAILAAASGSANDAPSNAARNAVRNAPSNVAGNVAGNAADDAVDHAVKHAVSDAAPFATSEAVRECVRDAAARRTALRITGAGTWLDAGRPVRAPRVLSLSTLAGVVDYTPGDLTLTARAGTTLDDIVRITAAERQWLPLDPAGCGAGTIGATVATGSAGALATGFGTPRDQVLGLEAVTGTGSLVRAGGRVVKNVAGFDLVRLFTGAWGTLAVLTEVTVRLRALPEVDETLALAVPSDATERAALLGALGVANIFPMAAELVNRALARHLDVGDGEVLLVRLGGNAVAVRAQGEALSRLADATRVDGSVWSALRASEPAEAAVVRLSAPPASFAALWLDATRAAHFHDEQRAGAVGERALLHGSPARGIVRCIVPPPHSTVLQQFLAASARLGCRRVAERLPESMWPLVESGAAALPLARRVREAFDPLGLLNPGILGEAP